MKKSYISFLFLCFYLAAFITPFSVKGQEQLKDSSSYYQKLYLTSQNTESLLKAYDFFDRSQQIAHSQNKKLNEALVYNHQAIIQKKLGFLVDSEQSAIEALKLLEEVKTTSSQVKQIQLSLNNHLGKTYREYKNYSKARSYYQKALTLTDSDKYKITLINNLGVTYAKENNYPEATNYLKKAYQLSLQSKDIIQQARALDNLGVLQTRQEHPDALTHLNHALELRDSIGFKGALLTSYLHLSTYFKHNNDLETANTWIEKASQLAQETQNIPAIEEVLTLKMDLKNDIDYQTLKHIKDSIAFAEITAANKYISFKYEKAKEKERADLNELLKEREQKKKIFYQSGGLLLLVISIATFFILKMRHRRDKLNEVIKSEGRIAKKIHDEVANDVYQLMTKVQTQTLSSTTHPWLDDLNQIYNKTRDISRENSVLLLEEPFDVILQNLFLNFKNNETSIVHTPLSKVNWKNLSKVKKITIYRVLQELLINMKKHSQAKLVVFKFEQNSSKIFITYKDNGLGTLLKDKNGLHYAETRMQSIGGSITFDTQPQQGFKAVLKL